MTSEDEVPSVTEYSDPDGQLLQIRVGSRDYLFEKDEDTGEWLYVRFITIVPSDEDDPEPFDPSEYR